MKSLKAFTLSLATAAIAMASAQAAPTVIHIVGSTAFRTGTSIAIIDTLAGTTAAGGAGSGSVFAASDGSSLAGASRQVFANGTIGTNGTATVIIETSWTGSLAGVVDLTAQSSAATFLDAVNNATVQASVNGGQLNTSTDLYTSETPAGGVALADANNTTTATEIDLAMSDSVKSTIAKELATGTLSAPIGSFTTISALATAAGSSVITDAGTSNFAGGEGDVAIAPFVWLVGHAPTGSTTTNYTAPSNINQQIARQLFTVGSVPQADFTGGNGTTDLANYFYLVGRNEDSGTRIGSLSESQFGVTANTIQYQVGDDSTTANPTLTFPANSALNTEPNISWSPAGHSGYSSGGNVASALEITPAATVTFTSGKASKNSAFSAFIGYTGLTDSASAVGGGATVLSYNGVAYSPAAVQDGSYTFWVYEHAYRVTNASGTILTTVNNIADNIFENDADAIYSATSGVSHAENINTGVYTSGSAGLFDDGFLNVTRSTTEGGPVNHK